MAVLTALHTVRAKHGLWITCSTAANRLYFLSQVLLTRQSHYMSNQVTTAKQSVYTAVLQVSGGQVEALGKVCC